MVDSKINAKKYFLPVYAVFVFVTSTITFLMAAYLEADQGESIISHLPWHRLASYFALFGIIWPLTLVVSPGFFVAVRKTTDLNFFQALTAGGYLGTKALVAYTLFAIAWIGPVIATVVAIYYHKKDVSKQVDEPSKFGWIDYLAAFI